MFEFWKDDTFSYENFSYEKEVMDISNTVVNITQEEVFRAVRNLLESLRKVSTLFKNKAFNEYNNSVKTYIVFLYLPKELYDVIKVYGYGKEGGVKINQFAVIKPSITLNNTINGEVYINGKYFKTYVLPLTGYSK